MDEWKVEWLKSRGVAMNLTMNSVPRDTLRPEYEGGDPSSPVPGLPAIAPPIAAIYNSHLQLQQQGGTSGSSAQRSQSTSSSGSGERMTPGGSLALPPSSNPLSPASQANHPITPSAPPEHHHLGTPTTSGSSAQRSQSTSSSGSGERMTPGGSLALPPSSNPLSPASQANHPITPSAPPEHHHLGTPTTSGSSAQRSQSTSSSGSGERMTPGGSLALPPSSNPLSPASQANHPITPSAPPEHHHLGTPTTSGSSAQRSQSTSSSGSGERMTPGGSLALPPSSNPLSPASQANHPITPSAPPEHHHLGTPTTSGSSAQRSQSTSSSGSGERMTPGGSLALPPSSNPLSPASQANHPITPSAPPEHHHLGTPTTSGSSAQRSQSTSSSGSGERMIPGGSLALPPSSNPLSPASQANHPITPSAPPEHHHLGTPTTSGSSAQRSQSTSSSGSGERMTPGGSLALPPSSNPLSPASQANHPITPSAPPEHHHLEAYANSPRVTFAGGFNFGDPTSALASLGSGGLPSTSGQANPLFHPHLMGVNRLPTSSAHLAMGRRYPCKLCTAMFESKAELQIHTQVHMREAKPYKCTHCPKSFANSSYLSQHMRIHLGIKPFGPCQYCGRKFTQLSHLQQHLRTHTGEKPYKCRYGGCEKAFSQLSNLQSHSRCHQADKPFKCNSCYKCFSQEQELLDHIPKHKESKHLKIHICPYCGKSYTQATYLAKHMTKHSDRRDRDIRLREMMRGDEQMWVGAPRDGAQICAVHGIPDSCGDTSPGLHYSFPTSSFGVPNPATNNCAYPVPSSSAPDSSAFSRFNALSALTGSMGRHAPNLGQANRSYFSAYDTLAKNTAHQAGATAFPPSAPYTSLIRLDDIRQYAGGGQAGPSAEQQFNMLNAKRDSY